MENGTRGMRALERGLAVLRAFSEQQCPQTVSNLARATELDRAVTRRVLATLEGLGYVQNRGGKFALRAKVLELGYSYLTSDPLAQVCREHLVEFSRTVNESCSAGVLEHHRVVYVATAQVRRIAGPSLTVGTSHVPYLTSVGRVLLASCDDQMLADYLAAEQLVAATDRTTTDTAELKDIITDVRENGWSLVDQELEGGVIGLAVPVCAPTGEVPVAINVTTHSTRVSAERAQDELLPQLREGRDNIERDLTYALT